MRAEGRVTLSCHKVLPGGIMDKFTVNAMSRDVNDVKKNYESMGYTVVVVRNGGK